MKKSRRGQTLIETLITLLFIAIGVLALVRFQNYLGYDYSLAHQKGDAVLLASKKIEELRDFQVLNNTAGFTSYQSIVSGVATVSGLSTTYTVTWTVTPFTNPTYKNVAVIVSWTDRNSIAQSVELNTHIAGIDPSNSAVVN